jgi:hypothetical protein
MGADDWERYELRMIDDYESEFTPDMDMGARPVNQEFGDFESLAFIEKKQKGCRKAPAHARSTTALHIEKNLKKGEVAIKVFPYTKAINNQEAAWLICNEDDRCEVIFEKISRKKGCRVPLKCDKYVLLAVVDQEDT